MARRKRQVRGRSSSGLGPAHRASVPVQEPTRLRIKASSDLLAVVPYVLGFHPEESFVVMHIRDGRVVMTGRTDIDTGESVDDLVDYLVDLARNTRASEVVLIAYSKDPAARELALEVAAGLQPFGLLDALLVDGERWWSLTCTQGCCPADGTPYDLAGHPLSAEAVFAGMTALPDRRALLGIVRGPDAAEVGELEAVAQRVRAELSELAASQRKELVARLVAGYLANPGALSDVECLRLAVLVKSVDVRDVAWAKLTRERADDHVELWRQVVARAPSRLAAAPLCLLGMAAWVSGNGALQNCCVERLEVVDPHYSLAGILADINRRALPPSFWDQMAREFAADPRLLAG